MRGRSLAILYIHTLTHPDHIRSMTPGWRAAAAAAAAAAAVGYLEQTQLVV